MASMYSKRFVHYILHVFHLFDFASVTAAAAAGRLFVLLLYYHGCTNSL